MTDYVDISIDLLTASLALGTGLFAFAVRNSFKGGAMGKPWQVIASSPFVLAAAEANHIYEDFEGTSSLTTWMHAVLEAGFVLMLFYGLVQFYRSREAPADEGEQ
jgi:TRAP-type C4-dicarboxylate transport system permease small subunit